MRNSNSYGNSNRGIRRFLRESGEKPTVARVEQIQREVSRSQSENERVVRESKERGGPSTVDAKGDVHARVKKIVRRELDQRKR